MITLACRNYDGTNAILRGVVKIPGLELSLREMHSVPAMFSGMFKGEFDVSEMSLAELIYYVSRDKADFIGIPVFPSRMFRHSFMFYKPAPDINSPGDLNGKRLGFLRWVQTAAIWMRGILMEDYGISPDRTEWHVAAMHHWDAVDPHATVEPRNGMVIRKIEVPGKNETERAYRALSEGRLDALGVTETQLALLESDNTVKRLFENPMEVEADYFRRTGILPIMHVLVIKKALVKRDPELPQKLFRLFSQAKKWAREWKITIPSMVMAWPSDHLKEEQRTFSGDPWAYGLSENRHVLEKFQTYCHAQGISAREISAEELFVPDTWDLQE
jgi:4,5-dihydroxyphthalate decarboxylase